MCSRSSSCTRSSPGTRTSHSCHSSSQAEAWRASASPKSAYRSADVPALTSVSLIARSRDV